MSAALTNYAQDIAQAHHAATMALNDAVGHAVRAGELLTQAKAGMPHGAFGAFCAGLPFAATTARGYMRLAQLDPAKRQRVADMPLRAALLELAEPRRTDAISTATAPRVVIPLGSVGTSMWRGPANEVRWFEVHPVLWPDGETIGLHYAFADIPEVGAAVCDSSRRPVRAATIGIEKLAQLVGAPLDTMRVIQGLPVLWEAECRA